MQKKISCLTLVAALALTASSALAQPAGGIPGTSLPGASLTLGADQLVSGSFVELPLLLEEGALVSDVFGVINTNPSELQIFALGVGAGLQQYIDDGGVVPTCDLIVEADGAAATFIMITPDYDVSVYGREYLTITVGVNGAAGTETSITVLGMAGETTVTLPIVAPENELMRGDVNADGNCDVTDAVGLLNVLFVPGTETQCEDAADVDDNGQLEVTDAVLLLSALFAGGPAIDESCQLDGSSDGLAPCSFSACP